MMFNNKKTKDKVTEKRIKAILNKRKKEHEKTYKIMVIAAADLIKYMWERKAEYVDELDTNVVIAEDVFHIAKVGSTLRFSAFTVDSYTGKSYYDESFRFNSQAEKEKYVEDVKACLPLNTKIIVTEKVYKLYYDMVEIEYLYYTFILELDK